jgi:cobalamin biosynthetic protein CobC
MDTLSKEPAVGVFHGGDIGLAEKIHGHPQHGWLDLSTGINPKPYPFREIGFEAYSKLPQRNSLEKLKGEAQRFYGTPSSDNVVPAPGTQALIQWLPRLRGFSRVAVVGPTYEEHFKVWNAVGHKVTMCGTPGEAPEDTEVMVVVSPNNPDGRRYPPDELEALRKDLAIRGGWLVVDEAFADVIPDLSLAGHCNKGGLIILRSFGKFFGLAGVRLGFALTNAALAKHLADALGPWAISGPAEAIGIQALGDKAWIEKTRRVLATGRQQLETLLKRKGFEIAGGTDLFLLINSEVAEEFHIHLARQGIWTRAFPEYPAWLRLGQPGSKKNWDRLKVALAGWDGVSGEE